MAWGIVPVAAVLAACSSSSSTTTSDAGADGHTGHADTGTHHDTGTHADTGTHTDASHDGGGGACSTYATAFCNYLSACAPGTLQTEYGTAAACEAQRAVTCTASIAATGSGSSATTIAACGAALVTEAAACKSGPVPPPIPTSTDACAIVGMAAGGAACGIDAQCKTDICTRTGTDCGQCTSPGAMGAACGPGTGVTCARGLGCSGSHELCVALVGATATCDFGTTNECIGGTQCVAGDAGATSGTCQLEGVAVGTACDVKGVGKPDCWAAAGYYCDTSTGSCAKIAYSASGSCGEADGGTSDNACLGGSCVAGTCVANAASGQACIVGAAGCVDGQICVGSADGGPAGTCTAIQPSCAAGDGGTLEFNFSPSNVSLADVMAQAGLAQVETVTTAYTVGTLPSGGQSSFNSPMVTVSQPDGSKVNLVVVKSLSVASTGSIVVTGTIPLVIVSLSDITFTGAASLQANGSGNGGAGPGATVGPGGGNGGTTGAGAGLGGGHAGSGTAVVAGGGGSYCGVGGVGGGGTASTAYGDLGIRPLVGGSGGAGGSIGDGGNGGGAVQLVAAGTISIAASSYITVSGGGGAYGNSACNFQNGGGGGSGGSILLEAPTVTVAGILVANGGGGGGGLDTGNSQDGWDSANVGASVSTAALGGPATPTGAGGPGSAGATLGGAALAGGASSCTGGSGNGAGGGGGGAGRIRINTATKSATITAANISPATMTTCTTQGGLRAITDGP